MAALWIRYSVGGGPVRINIDGMSDVMDLVQYICTTQPKLKGVDASDVIVHSPDNVTKYRLSQTLNELIALSTEDHPLIVKFALPHQYGPLSTGISSNNALHPSPDLTNVAHSPIYPNHGGLDAAASGVWKTTGSKNKTTISSRANDPMEVDTAAGQPSALEKKLWSIEELTSSDLVKSLDEFSDHYRNAILAAANFVFDEKNGVTFCNNRCSLLLHQLPEMGQQGYVPQAKLNEIDHGDTVLIMGVSGSGKTRTVFEFLCQNYGLYFVADQSRVGNYGSSDLSTLIDRLSGTDKLCLGRGGDNQKYVARYMLSILAARMYIMEMVMDMEHMTPKRWLILQLDLQDNDWFLQLTHIFRQASEHYLETYLARSIATVRQTLCIEKKIPVFLDEAQFLLTMLDNYFDSAKGKSDRPLFSAVFKSFGKCKPLRVMVCGTGLRMNLALELASSPVAKFDDSLAIVTIENYLDKIMVEQHFSKYFGDVDITRNHISKWLVGRPRLLFLFIENYLRAYDCGTDVAAVFDLYKASMCSRNNNGGLYMTYASVRMRIKNDSQSDKILERARNMLQHYISTGLPIVVHDENDISIFEHGFARLTYTANKLGVVIDEPLAVLAGCEYFRESFDNNVISRMEQALRDPGSLGKVWEEYFPRELKKYFAGLKTFEGFPAGCEFSIHSDDSFQPNILCTRSTAEYGLCEFLHTQNAEFMLPDELAGPDVVCRVCVKYPSGESKLYPCFAQLKLKKSVGSVAAALRTIDEQFLYVDKNGKTASGFEDKKRKISSMCQDGYIGLLVMYPHSCKRLNIRNHDDKCKLKVFDANNAVELFGQRHLDFLDRLKGTFFTEGRSLE